MLQLQERLEQVDLRPVVVRERDKQRPVGERQQRCGTERQIDVSRRRPDHTSPYHGQTGSRIVATEIS
ncbi:MAG: hypothetical protein ACOC6J_08400, partial [Spirochaetota bacterium]